MSSKISLYQFISKDRNISQLEDYILHAKDIEKREKSKF